MLTQAPRGTKDVLPADSYRWQYVESKMRQAAAEAGFREVRTPVFEHTELFLRGVGDTTDIVQKEMYTFKDKGDRSITLKPEGTAGAARCLLENNLYADTLPCKMYYLNAPIFRYEAPQSGRLREHHQFGLECFGARDASADAEQILLAYRLLSGLGVKNLSVNINSIGCPTCRAEYRKALRTYFEGYKDQLCETCNSRLERNPMRILDCKSPVCGEIAKGAPKITDYLCDDCRAHFEKVQTLLKSINIPFSIDPGLVRGLDYYTRTVFEFPSKRFGFALGGGGRYDGLVEEVGGKPTPALGFGLGLDRILMAMNEMGADFGNGSKCEVYIASLGEAAQMKAFQLTEKMHSCGIAADCDLCARGLKAQMKYADKIGAQYSIVLGDDEIANGEAVLKNMKTGEKKKISLNDDFVDTYITAVTEQEDAMPITF